MFASPSETLIHSLVSAARSAMISQPVVAPMGDMELPIDEACDSSWRKVIRHLPRDLEYVSPDDIVDEELKCPVCLAWPTDPVLLGCPAGHMLCRACSSGLRVCPLDRQSFAATSPVQDFILARLDRLQARCPYVAAGCSWIGSRGTIMEHCEACDYALDECRQCGSHVRRRERAAHMHAFQVGAHVRYVGQNGDGLSYGDVGEVLRTDSVSDLVTVNFRHARRSCHRSQLVWASDSDAASWEERDAIQTAASSLEDGVAAERRLAQIDSVLNIYEQAERLNACFVVDCTGSMSSHIHAVRSQILRIVREMQLRLPSMQLHIAFVGYRDHGDSVRHEVFPFTTSVENFRQFVGTVGAWGCGGDVPEDVLGGLDQALGLEWGVGGAATRVLIHIGDAPCHGEYYQDRDVFRHRDNHPAGDPLGLQSTELLHQLKEKDVQYIFGRINQSTDKMIRLFDEEAGGGYIQTREMRDTNLIAETVTVSLHASVAATVSTLSAEGRAPNRVKTSDEVPYWGEICPESVELRRCKQVESLADLLKGADPSATQRFVLDSVRVQLGKLPFSQGETRAARYALVDGREHAVAKHMKGTSAVLDEVADAEEEFVEQECPAGFDEFLSLSEVSAVAAFLAHQFSAERELGSKIRFLESHVAIPLANGRPFNLEDALPAEEFLRFSNNIGWWEPGADELLMKFMRWTHAITEGHMMVVDLQGVRTVDGFVLTDPCILCADVTRFGSGNLGPRALERCLASLSTRLDNPMHDEPAYEEVPPIFRCTTYAPVALPPYSPEKVNWGGGTAGPVSQEVDQPTQRNVGALNTAASTTSTALSAAFSKVGMTPSKASGSPNKEQSSGQADKTCRGSMQRLDESALDVDSILASLLVPSGMSRSSAKLPCEKSIQLLLMVARKTILAQPALLELEAPLNILGDIHGQFPDLLRFFEFRGVDHSSYLLLGDYVDRGRQSLEVIILLLALKVKRPENMFLLRGNHECASITRIYGFYDECKRRFNIKLWKQFCDVFNCFPVAAVIDEKIFCCHGGLSPELNQLDSVRRIVRPCDIPDTGLMCDLLWSDPDKDIGGWVENDRGVSYTFGPDVVASFLTKFDLDLVVRAHQVVEDGYEFFAQRRLVTLFSAPNYCGEFDNSGAIMTVEDDLECSFKLVKKVGRGKK